MNKNWNMFNDITFTLLNNEFKNYEVLDKHESIKLKYD